jgi:hypothetical protein
MSRERPPSESLGVQTYNWGLQQVQRCTHGKNTLRWARLSLESLRRRAMSSSYVIAFVVRVAY